MQSTKTAALSAILRTFLADRSTRRAMARFIGTFVYAMALLPEVRGAEALGGERVPAFSVFFAFALVLLSVGVFVQYNHGMAHSIRAVHVLNRVAAEASASFGELYLNEAALEPESEVASPSGPPDHVVGNGDVGGVLAAVDADALKELACEADAVIEVVPSLGDFIVRGGPLFRVWGVSDLDHVKMRRHVAIAEERTPHQDPAFAFRQLVSRASSVSQRLWSSRSAGSDFRAGPSPC